MSKTAKTNAMRILDKAGISYETKEYEYDESDLSGLTAADKMGADPNSIFKTLVLRGEKTGIMVCIIPVNQEINLKGLAAFAKDKRVEMIHLRELLPLTGYMRGGCSPIGMKKIYPTYIESSCLKYDVIGISGGKRGLQIILSPHDIIKITNTKIFENYI